MKKLRLFDSLKFVLATVACVFILNVAHAATLPAGYTELEYLESTGTQYIDTGYSPNTQNVKYVYSVQSTSTDTTERHPARIAGGRIQIYRKSSAWNIYESSPHVSSSAIPNLGIMDKVDFVVENNYDNSLAIWANNINVTGNYTTRSNTYTSSIILFAFGSANSNKFIGRVYYFRVYENGVLRFNAVPARRDSDGMLGMYDLADSNPATAFHTNADTGEFVAGPAVPIKIATTKYNEESFAPVKTDLSAAVNAVEYVVSNTMSQAQQIDQIANEKQTRPDEGCPAKYCLLVEDEDGTPHWYPIAGANGVAHNLPAGYTELQYIESTGTQYIDTGIKGNMGVKADLDFSVSNTISTNFLLAARKISAQDTRFYLCTFSVQGVGQFDIALGKDSFSPEVVANQRYNYVMDTTVSPATLVIDGGKTITNNNSYDTNLNMYLFASNTAGEASFGGATPIRIYYAKIWEGNTLVRDFVPAKNSSNVIGMYDMVSGQFFTNAGTGTFTAGPDM